jgi:putative ABC transport system permease protein
MRVLREIGLGIKNLLQHKLRSLLTMLGMVFGVGSVIAMLAVGEGASEEALLQIRKLGSNNIIVSAQKPTEDDESGSNRVRMSIFGLTYDDHRRIATSIPHVLRAAPVKMVRKEGRLGENALELRVLGTTPEWFELVRRDMVAGRPLSPHDTDTQASVAILTEFGARRLLASRSTIGQVLRLAGDSYTIVGIVRSETGGGGGIQTPDDQVDVYVPLATARARFGDTYTIRSAGARIRERVELHTIIAEVDDTERVPEAAAAIEHMLDRFHRRNDYKLSVPLALLRQAEATKRTFNIVLGSIAGISLLVGGIGIMNIMLASVTERTREIGIRRAIGARRAQIVRQFLIETVVLSTAGGLIGVAIGLFIPWMVTRVAGMPTIVTGSSLLLSVGISMGVGIVFGLYPAVRASRLDPIEALRYQ